MADKTANTIIRRIDNLKTDRSNWESLWQEVAHFALPRKAFITKTRSPGERLPTTIYDSTALQSAQVFAAGLNGNLTNPASKWFSLRTQDKDLMDDKEVRSWMKQVEDKIFDVLAGSNFYDQVHECYIDLGVFGTATLFEQEDPKSIVRFNCMPINEIFIVEDSRGRVDTVYRKFKFSARQAFQKWGDAAGEDVKESMVKKEFEKEYPFIHCVTPRDDRDTSKDDAANMPFASLWISVKSKKVVAVGGFEEMPFFVPRFAKTSDELYGYSPAIISLADIKMLNTMALTNIKAAQKIVDPPLILPHDGFILPLKTTPGGINYKISGSAGDRIEPLQTGGNIPVGFEMIERTASVIRANFFVDLFLTLANRGNMTATEVQERIAEKMLLLGPTLGRLMSEMLDPIVERTFSILLRNQLLPEPPEALQGRDFQIEYISPLARNQKLSDANAINTVLLTVGQMAQLDPGVIDKIDLDTAIDEIARIQGIDPDIVRDSKEVAQIREQRAKQQQAAEAMAGIQQLADVGKTAQETEAIAKQ